MGTRHLIEVKLDGELKVAQYGQWDGYPTGQGCGIADFLHKEMDKEKFKTALRACRFFSEEDKDSLEELEKTDWKETHPWLSRDSGARVLKHVQDDGARLLGDEREFKNDKLFCEYHYLIDMDNETVSVNGAQSIPFAEWTRHRMNRLEEDDVE